MNKEFFMHLRAKLLHPERTVACGFADLSALEHFAKINEEIFAIRLLYDEEIASALAPAPGTLALLLLYTGGPEIRVEFESAAEARWFYEKTKAIAGETWIAFDTALLEKLRHSTTRTEVTTAFAAAG